LASVASQADTQYFDPQRALGRNKSVESAMMNDEDENYFDSARLDAISREFKRRVDQHKEQHMVEACDRLVENNP